MTTADIGIGLIGCGTVGGGVAQLLAENADLYTDRLGKTLALRRVLVRNATAQRHEAVDRHLITDDPNLFFSAADMPIVVEVAGGLGVIGDYVRRALSMGKHVVTANKSLLAAQGPQLFRLAGEHQASVAFEASCGGGIPIVTALQFGLMANRIEALYGILNGTCNYILTEMTRSGKTYSRALAEAQEEGFAESDPTLDISGEDAAQKLAVLASLAFDASATIDDVWFEGIDGLDLADLRFGRELDYDVKLLAIAERSDQGRLSLRVHPSFVHADSPLAQVHGPFNALSVYGHATGHTMYYGRGAGRMPTASAVVSDVINVASTWYPRAFSAMNLWCNTQSAPELQDPKDLMSRFYLRISALDEPGVVAQVSRILGEAGISLSALLQHEVAVGQFVPVVIVTHQARQGAVMGALKTIEQLKAVHGPPICIRIVDLPEG